MRDCIDWKLLNLNLLVLLLLLLLVGAKMLFVEPLSVRAPVLDILDMRIDWLVRMAFWVCGSAIVDIRIVPWSVGRHAFGKPQRTTSTLAGRWGEQR